MRNRNIQSIFIMQNGKFNENEIIFLSVFGIWFFFMKIYIVNWEKTIETSRLSSHYILHWYIFYCNYLCVLLDRKQFFRFFGLWRKLQSSVGWVGNGDVLGGFDPSHYNLQAMLTCSPSCRFLALATSPRGYDATRLHPARSIAYCTPKISPGGSRHTEFDCHKTNEGWDNITGFAKCFWQFFNYR